MGGLLDGSIGREMDVGIGGLLGGGMVELMNGGISGRLDKWMN